MGPIRAIKNGLTKLFVFSGRTTRSEYWWFVTPFYILAIKPIGLTFEATDEPYSNGTTVLILVFLFAASVTSVGVRRAHDAGSAGVLFAVLLWTSAVLWVGLATGFYGLHSSETNISQSHAYWSREYATRFWIIGYMVPPLITVLIAAASLFPSQPGPNKYGPNPHEVTP